MKPPFEINWQIITPAMAEKWLEKNTHNRSLRSATVQAFARDIERRAWSPNHQGIAFDEDGVLIDGQHRLAAIVVAKVAVPMLVCSGIPKRITGVKADVMDTVDRGNTRSIADLLRLQHGYTVNAGFVAACVTVVSIISSDSGVTFRCTMPQTVAVIERYRASLAWVSENRAFGARLCAAGIAGAVVFAHAVAPKESEEFYKGFNSGAGLHSESPTLVVRNFIQHDDSARSVNERRSVADIILHAIWCLKEGKTLKRIPRATERLGAAWFREQQPENMAFLEEVFPKVACVPRSIKPRRSQLDAEIIPIAPAVPVSEPRNENNVKLTPLAESLIKGKEMSDRLKRRGVDA